MCIYLYTRVFGAAGVGHVVQAVAHTYNPSCTHNNKFQHHPTPPPQLPSPSLRPAAIDQLVKLGKKIDVPVFELGNQVSPVEIARQGVARAKEEGYDTVIVDTAGRLQVRNMEWIVFVFVLCGVLAGTGFYNWECSEGGTPASLNTLCYMLLVCPLLLIPPYPLRPSKHPLPAAKHHHLHTNNTHLVYNDNTQTTTPTNRLMRTLWLSSRT